MKIREITEYVRKYVHPDVHTQLKKYEKRATGRARMGYAPGYMSYPYRVKAETKEAPPGTYFTKSGNLVKNGARNIKNQSTVLIQKDFHKRPTVQAGRRNEILYCINFNINDVRCFSINAVDERDSG